jgi:hypothetical protein
MNSVYISRQWAMRCLLSGLIVIALLMTTLPATAQDPDPDWQNGDRPDPTAKRTSQVQGGGQPLPSSKIERDDMPEGFESGSMPPPGWTHLQTNPNETWYAATHAPHSGSYHADVLYDPALLDQDEVLLSPTFDADSGDVSLWSYGSLYWCRDTYDNCDLEVWLVKGNWDAGSGDDIYLGSADDDWVDTWTYSYSTFDFTPYASGDPTRIAFRYVGNNGAEVSLDDVEIHFDPPPDPGPLVYNDHTVDDDNNQNSSGDDDGVVDPGETIELYVTLRNQGTGTITGVDACISTSDPYVTFIYNTCSSYPDIPAGGTAFNSNDFDFEVHANTPSGHVIDFDLSITASGGWAWSDDFSVPVLGTSGNTALISDQSELQDITPVLDDMGIPYDVVNDNWNGTQGIYTSDYSFLSGYDVVIWYASGYTYGRNITQQEYNALDQFLQAGGRLLVTGYDTLGNPTDPLLADLVRSSSSGDGPFTHDYAITDGGHPITDGPYGSFPTGTTLVAGHLDHDQAEADTSQGATTVAELTGGRDKIIATELTSGGRVVYWNGNRNCSDWTMVWTMVQGQQEDREHKRDANGRPIGNLSIEDLQEQAQQMEADEVPPDANYAGSDPVWYVPLEVLPRSQPAIASLNSQNVVFPAAGDILNVTNYPYWWHAGDYAQGSRTLSLNTVNRLDYNMAISYNSLNGTGHADFDLYINGSYVGGFTVWPGEYSKSLSFSFSPINGPVYTVRLEETNTVDPGAGSIIIPLDTSNMTFFGPSTAQQASMLKNTLHWLTPVSTPGDPHEPNDYWWECTQIPFDVPITDPTIDPPGDYDYYCFQGTAGHTIVADIFADVNGSLLDSVLTLFDSDGVMPIAEDDDGGGGLDSHLEYTLPHDGAFYLRVRDYMHPSYGGPAYFYTILLNDIPPTSSLPFFDDMESGINGWSTDGLWHQVQDGVSPYPNSHSPTHSWWYGQDSTGDYNTGGANSGNLTSPPLAIPDGANATLSFWQWYETEPSLSPQTIYFDVYHDTDGDSISGGSYTEWANELEADGYSVVERDQVIDLATLSGYQVLALFDPEVPLTTAEIAAINAFMQNGGRVVVLGEWGNLDNTNTILNALSTAHGITFNSDVVYDSSDNDGQDSWPLIYNFADDPLVSGVNTVVLYAGCSLSLSGPAASLATADSDATATVAAVSGTASGADEDGFGSDQALQPLDIVPGAPVVMAHAPVGDGQLIAVGDSGLWTHADPDGDGTIALDEYSNQTLSRLALGEEIDNSAWDQKWIQVSVDGGPFQDVLQVTGGPMRTWHQYSVNLSSYNDSVVRIRFHFDTLDSVYNNHRGWYIDDVRVGYAGAGPVEYYGHTIDDDNADESSGDDDGISDPGETIEISVELKNHGTDTATNVRACITEDSPYATGPLFNDCADYGDIAGGSTAVNAGSPADFDFTIAPNAPVGHVIHFDLLITADNGGPWASSFNTVVGQSTIVGPLIHFSPGDIIDDDNSGQSSGNGNGVINPGETIELNVGVGNAGSAIALDIQACISEYSSYVDGFDFNTCSDYGDISGGGTATNLDDFDFEVDSGAPDGHLIHMCLNLTAANGGPWNFCFDLPVVGGPTVDPELRIEPPDQEVPLSGGTFQVDVAVHNVTNLGAFQFDLTYNPAILHVVDAELGPFLSNTGCTAGETAPTIDNTTGRLSYGGFILGACNGPSGDGVVATVTLHPEAEGDSNLTLENEELLNSDSPPTQITPVMLYHGHVDVTDDWFADMDGDGDVDIADIYNVAYRWGCQCGDTCYDPAYDLNDDCAISISDIQIAACYFGWPNGDFSGCYAPAGAMAAPMTDTPATLRLTPDEIHLQPGDPLTVDLTVEQAQDVAGFEALLHYDPRVLDFQGLTPGGFLASTGNAVVPREAHPDAGTVTLGSFSFGEHDSPDGSGTLVSLAFNIRGPGESSLTLSDVQLVCPCGLPQPTPIVVSGFVTSGQSLYLPLVHK